MNDEHKKHDEQTEAVEEKVEQEVAAEKASEKSAEDEARELKDQLLRALAEMENLRKRASKEREEASKYAIASFARSVLSVADNLRRGLDMLPEEKLSETSQEVKNLVEGMKMTEKELLSVLEKNGVKKVNPKGEAFDHNFHQAMMEIETSEHAEGTVVEVMQDGYVINDRLLRPAMVGVAKAPKA